MSGNLQEQLMVFDEELAVFASRHNLGHQIFRQPESITIQPPNTRHFIALQRVFARRAERMAIEQRNWKFLTVAKLNGQIALPHFGEIEWVEICEPTKKQTHEGQSEIASVRFIYPEPERLRTWLARHRVRHDRDEEGIVVRLPESGKKVEFTDAEAEPVFAEKLRTKEAIEVRLSD